MQFRFVGPGVSRKDVEDQFTAIDDDPPSLFFEVAPLSWREVIVEDDHFRTGGLDEFLQFREFAFPKASGGMRPFPVLHQRADDLDAGCFDQALKLVERMFSAEIATGIGH